MNTKNVVKRLAAVATGAAMLGATVMGAFAADLSDYPDMFVADGTFDGYFVVGEAAASVDNLAMTDIATNMWYMAAGDDATTTTTIEGDAWLAATSSNFLELGESITSVEGYLDSSMLDALADGEISNAKGTADYEQFLYFSTNGAEVAFQEDDDDNVGFFYKINSSSDIARYVVDFTTALESDVDSNGDFDDIEDEKISVFGREYTITTARNDSRSTQLILMGGAASDTINEGETKTYTVGDESFEVELLSVTSTQVQFSINGETTSKLADSETDVLEDGVTNIGITDITYQAYAGGIHSASFFLGADKIELKDGNNMKVNEETINEATVVITETYSGGDISISEISVNMTAEDDLYVAEGGKLSEATDLDEPEVLFTQNWDLEFSSVDVEIDESIDLTFSESDEQADLTMDLYSGDVVMPLAYINNSGDNIIAGEKDGQELRWTQFENIRKNDYFIVSTANPTDDQADAKSYLLQYKGSDATGDDSPKATIKDVASGEDLEVSVAAAGTFDLRLGGTTFSFRNMSEDAITSTDDFDINLTSGGFTGIAAVAGEIEQRYLSFRTADNHWVRLQDTDANITSDAGATAAWTVEVMLDDTDKMDDSTDVAAPYYTLMNVTLNVSSEEFTATIGTLYDGQAGVEQTGIANPDDSDITWYRSSYGELLTTTSVTSSPDKFELDLPSVQAEVLLYVTSGAVSSSTTTSADGTLTAVRVVDATKLDSEVSSVSAQNLIVVGGPCVNSVAAELAGNPSDCTEGYSAGVANVQLFENGDSVAMLVAGYSGDDTRLAGQVLAHRYDELTGESLEIEGTTYSDATIAAPSAAAEEVVEEEAAAEEEVTEE